MRFEQGWEDGMLHIVSRKQDAEGDDARWYALDVVRQKEYLAGYILNHMGYPTFIPTETRWRRKNRYAKGKTEIAIAAVPGTIFVQLPLFPCWPRLLELSMVTGVLSIGDVPMPLDTKELWTYRSTQLDGRLIVERVKARGRGGMEVDRSQRSIFVQGRGVLRAPKEQRHMRSKREIVAGGQAMIVEGPFRFLSGKVLRIGGRRAQVLLPLFGAEAGGVTVTVPLNELEAVA